MEAPHQETDPLLFLVSTTQEESDAAAVVTGSSPGEDSVTIIEAEQQQQQQHSSSKAAFDFDLFWEIKFEELKVFREENGHCCVSQKSSKKEEQLSNNLLSLGAWVKEQRQQHKSGKLSEEVPPN